LFTPVIQLFALSAFAILSYVPAVAQAPRGGSISAKPQVTQRIDQGSMVSLPGHVIKALTPARDMGAVEDASPVRLYLNLQRTPEQQSDLDSLLSEQQNAASPNFHKWLTPEQFGERFGVAQSDINAITIWLSSRGFDGITVAKNASVVSFKTTAGGVRDTFHAQLHYWNIAGGKYAATANEPQIPAALSHVVSGIAGLSQIPLHGHHSPIKQQAYDAVTHKWHTVDTAAAAALAAGETPHYLDGFGRYVVTPQDFYTIYNVNPTFAAGNTGSGATVAIISDTDFMFGTVNPNTGQATGGDVATFRSLFGVPGTLNMTVQHGDVTYPCSDPGGDSGETALDSEWSNALAPTAHLIVATCADADGGALNSLQALINDNVADIISSSLGAPETLISSGELSVWNTILPQAAAQGQTFLVAEGDSGDDDLDFGSPGPATHGLSIDFPGSHPYALSIGGTDFQDLYDQDKGGNPQTTYWGANSKYYGNALGYVPETVWEDSCASSLFANDPFYGNGLSPLAYCDTASAQNAAVSGGGEGGISVVYDRPAYQTGIQGLSSSITKRVTPDISGFAAGGYWGHLTVACDSGTDGGANSACTSPTTFGGAGGTSFAAPELAGVFALLKAANGRQGLVQPTLYALATAQYSQGGGAACYANGQAVNNGVTTGLPVSTCIFHDVTTGNNDNPCVAGSPNCYAPGGASIGILTASADTSVLTYAYPSAPGYDIATGLGSVNVTNLITKWNTAFSSTTSLSANPTSITSAQSTALTAKVLGGTPPNYVGSAPVVSGTVTFKLGGATLGSCALVSGTCSTNVAGTALQSGSNSITAVYGSSGTYPASTSTAVTVTVTSATKTAQTITFGVLANKTYGAASFPLTASASSGLAVAYQVTGPATISGSTLKITGAGIVTVTASQAGNATYAAATPVMQSFTVAKAILTATVNNASRAAGVDNPTFTYTVSGYVNGDSSPVVSGTATLTTTATNTSPAGSYPITFATKALVATNYTFTYVNGTLTVTPAVSSSFTITPLPPVETINRGVLGAFLLELKSVNGFSGNVSLSCSGGPTGAQCKDFPMTVKVKGEALALSGILFPKNSTPGSYVITFTGVSGTTTAKTTATFIVK
jgi:subtilase family serine protease